MTSEVIPLAPCPFCGGKASVEQFGNTRVSTIYRCGDCQCQLETGEEFNHGRAWNRRASPALAETSGGGEAHERVARAIARGCNLDPDAISPKAALSGHEIPEWMFFMPAASLAIAEIERRAQPDGVVVPLDRDALINLIMEDDISFSGAGMLVLASDLRHVLSLLSTAERQREAAEANGAMWSGQLIAAREHTARAERQRDEAVRALKRAREDIIGWFECLGAEERSEPNLIRQREDDLEAIRQALQSIGSGE